MCRLLQESRGYRLGPPGNRDVIRTHNLFVDDLKLHQESQELLKLSMRLSYRQAMIQGHAMEYHNVLKLYCVGR